MRATFTLEFRDFYSAKVVTDAFKQNGYETRTYVKWNKQETQIEIYYVEVVI